MLNEGLHLSDISGVLLLRPTNSNIIWHQQIGRCIESNNSKNPVIIDAVNNFNSVQQGIGLLQEIKEAVAKEKESGNRGSGDSGWIDIDTFFVTEYVQNVQEMFGQIEGRLKDGWDFYIKALEQYKEREGDCLVPQKHIEILEDGTEINLGKWVDSIRQAKKGKNNYLLTLERIKQLNDLQFAWNTESMFEKFYKYVILYKEKFGNVNIKQKDKIDGYNIGMVFSFLLQEYKKGRLANEQIVNLKEIGIDVTKDKHGQQFQMKMQLVQKALSENIKISRINPIYQDVNLYNWYRNCKSKFTDEEIEIIERLIPNCHTKKVVIIDIKDGKVKTFSSISEAGRALYNDFHLVNTEKSGRSIITNRLTGHIKNPVYKGLRFEYVDEEPLKEKSPTIKKVSS